MSRKRFKRLIIYVVITIAIISNYRSIIRITGVFDNTISMRGCRWGDSPAEVIKTVGDVEMYGTGTHYAIGEYYGMVDGIRTSIFFFFDPSTAQLRMIDYEFSKSDYDAIREKLNLVDTGNAHTIYTNTGNEMHLYKTDVFAHVTIVPRGEEYRLSAIGY